MAKLHFKCACGKALAVDEKFAGQTARCPGCQRPVKVPDLPNAPPPEPIKTQDMAREISALSSAYGKAMLARARKEKIQAALSERKREVWKRNLLLAASAAAVLFLGFFLYPLVRGYGPNLLSEEYYPEPTRPFLRGLTRRDPRVRAAATWEIADAGGSRAVELVTEMLGDREPLVKLVAMWNFAVINKERALDQLAPLLHDGNIDVRMTAALLLAGGAANGLTPSTARLHVLEALKRTGRWLHWLEGLSDKTPTDEISEYLAAQTQEANESTLRIVAWLAVATLDLDRALPILRELLRSELPAVRVSAIHALRFFLTADAFGRLKTPEAPPGELRERIRLLYTVAQKMRHHEGSRVKTAAPEVLEVRRAAALAAAGHGQNSAADVFREPLTDEDWFIRFAAAKGLALLEPKAALSILNETREMREDNDWVQQVIRRIRERAETEKEAGERADR